MGPIKNSVPPEKVKRLAADLLSLAADKFGNHVCNDLARPDYFTEEEWLQLAKDYEQWNSGGQDEVHPLGDFSAMNWCSVLLEEGAL